MRAVSKNLVMYRLPHEKKKNYGFTPNLDFNPLLTRFNFTEFLPTYKRAFREYAAHQGEDSTSKHDISTVL